MRLPIDECVDERLRLLFQGHECQTARYANMAGLKNVNCWGRQKPPGSTF
jgi:hypothetical protein